MNKIKKEDLVKLEKGICDKIREFKALGKVSKKGVKLVGMLAGQVACYPYLQETFGLTAPESYDIVARLALDGGFKIIRTHGFGGLFLLNEDVKAIAPKAEKVKADKYKAFR